VSLLNWTKANKKSFVLPDNSMKPSAQHRLDLIYVKWLKRVAWFIGVSSVIAAIVGWGAIIMGVR
jgi:hypothetical protein